MNQANLFWLLPNMAKCGLLPEHTRNETEIGTNFPKPDEDSLREERKRGHQKRKNKGDEKD